ncbi:MAG: hypothetical protein R3B09_27060 [Nannocystaceae bacterium]
MTGRRRAAPIAAFVLGCGALAALLLVALETTALGLVVVSLVTLGSFGLSARGRRRSRPPGSGMEGLEDMPRNHTEKPPRIAAESGAPGPEVERTRTHSGVVHSPPTSALVARPRALPELPPDPGPVRVQVDETARLRPLPPPVEAELAHASRPPAESAPTTVEPEVEVAEPPPPPAHEPLEELLAGSTRSFRALQQRLAGTRVKVSPSTLEIDEAGRVRGITWQASLGEGSDPRRTLPLVSIAALRGDEEVAIRLTTLDASRENDAPGSRAPAATPDPFAAFRTLAPRRRESGDHGA